MRINEVLHLSEYLCVRPKKKFTKINCCKCSSEAQNSPPTRTALHTSKKILAMSEESATLISLTQFLRLDPRRSSFFLDRLYITETIGPPVSHHTFLWCLISALALMLPATARTNACFGADPPHGALVAA